MVISWYPPSRGTSVRYRRRTPTQCNRVADSRINIARDACRWKLDNLKATKRSSVHKTLDGVVHTKHVSNNREINYLLFYTSAKDNLKQFSRHLRTVLLSISWAVCILVCIVKNVSSARTTLRWMDVKRFCWIEIFVWQWVLYNSIKFRKSAVDLRGRRHDVILKLRLRDATHLLQPPFQWTALLLVDFTLMENVIVSRAILT